jgi:nucleoside-diphosphate-sugar epimerase
MSKGLILITGATGMAGNLAARRAVDVGYDVRVLVRSLASQGPLPLPNVERYVGDLAAPESLPAALEGVDYVVHAAAFAGDWGPVEKYRAINVFALEHLLTAAKREGRLKRWIQISSLGVYPARHHHGTDETTPPDVQGLDGYTRTKAEAEILLKDFAQRNDLPFVILRPGFMYGPGDRHILPRLIEKIEAGKMKLIGDGQKLMNNTYVGNLIDAVLLSLEKDAALGETFNIRDGRLVTREEFVGTIADYLGKPRPGRVPLPVARFATGIFEGLARLRRSETAPLLTRARIKFLTLNLDFSIAKAQRLLGYEPRVDFQEGMRAALEWAKPRTAA